MTEQLLTVTGLGPRGEGRAAGPDGPVLIPYTLAGETVLVDVEAGRGRLLRVQAASVERVQPFCPYFAACGGCQFQHWDETPYRRWKRGLVETALRARQLDFPVGEMVDAHGAGRRRVSLHVRRDGGAVTAGFMAARSHELQDITRCPILVPALADAPDMARRIGEKLGDCDVVFTATASGIDALVKAERKIAEREAPKLAVLANDLDVARLRINDETIVTRRPPAVKMGPANVLLPSASFLQATAEGEERLAELVMAAVGRAKSVADLFAGCGPFTFRLAQRARVAAFDIEKPAIAALDHAARATPGLKPVSAMARDLFRAPLVVNELKPFDAIVFDPPRAGAEAQCRQIARSSARTAVAVSCDPASLARDLEILIGGGYRLESVTPVDQFKWTSHIETVAVLRKA